MLETLDHSIFLQQTLTHASPLEDTLPGTSQRRKHEGDTIALYKQENTIPICATANWVFKASLRMVGKQTGKITESSNNAQLVNFEGRDLKLLGSYDQTVQPFIAGNKIY